MNSPTQGLPDTDSPEVMQQAISAWLTSMIWEQTSRLVPDEKVEEEITSIYSRVYKLVNGVHRS